KAPPPLTLKSPVPARLKAPPRLTPAEPHHLTCGALARLPGERQPASSGARERGPEHGPPRPSEPRPGVPPAPWRGEGLTQPEDSPAGTAAARRPRRLAGRPRPARLPAGRRPAEGRRGRPRGFPRSAALVPERLQREQGDVQGEARLHVVQIGPEDPLQPA